MDPRHDWTVVPDDRLAHVVAAALESEGGIARVVVSAWPTSCDASVAEDFRSGKTIEALYDSFERGKPQERKLPGSGVPVTTFEFSGTERRIAGFLESPRSKPQRGRVLVAVGATRVIRSSRAVTRTSSSASRESSRGP
ncbi:hypothetical protein HY251_19555 [bacterium]|nr:hypothetical protein [bacterium]